MLEALIKLNYNTSPENLTPQQQRAILIRAKSLIAVLSIMARHTNIVTFMVLISIAMLVYIRIMQTTVGLAALVAIIYAILLFFLYDIGTNCYKTCCRIPHNCCMTAILTTKYNETMKIVGNAHQECGRQCSIMNKQVIM